MELLVVFLQVISLKRISLNLAESLLNNSFV